jgi:hypothetical protein
LGLHFQIVQAEVPEKRHRTDSVLQNSLVSFVVHLVVADSFDQNRCFAEAELHIQPKIQSGNTHLHLAGLYYVAHVVAVVVAVVLGIHFRIGDRNLAVVVVLFEEALVDRNSA